ncbi:uncharacterized protein LOC114263496 isoform X4 [Camellia sinensis]|uniref:uncharacterized protein LOC114263496 isoform X4 n=1 Tax=Camellia sinensis TaxID=4442 RepID=UPI0010361AE2|nr:uncharacterized protein LOC114263496 isoform X4 [Camellia sinensis]
MEDEQVLWPSTDSDSNSNSMVSATLGRVMSTLLSARPKKLQDAISRLHSPPKRGSFVTLEESLWILHTYVREAAQREESLDEILVPITQHSLKHKESKHGNQAMILFNWLFQDEIIFQALATNLAGIIRRKDDRYIALGWCILVRGLVEYEISMKQFINNGIKDKYRSLLKFFSSCISHLISIVCIGSCSTLQGGFELPTRLSVAAADCILALTEALTKKDLVSDGGAEKAVLYMHMGWRECLSGCKAQKGIMRTFKLRLAGSQMHKTGVLLLSSCWKHYGMLMHLEDYKFYWHYKELVDQYLSGIQFYADNYTEEHAENKESGVETIKFFLNCLSLLLGHLDGKQFENAMSEDGLRISRVLISQLHCADVDVIDGAVCILKAVIFRSNSSLAGSSLTNTREMDALLPLLLHLLDERDGTARAVVVLIAEYCSISTDNQCLKEVLQRLASGAVLQRRNAIDVISELFHISPDSVYCRQDIANHLLKLLGDEELVIRAQATKLIPMMDPSLLLPALVRLVCSSDEVVHSSARNAFVAVLKYHNKKFEVLCMLLDCLSNICQNPDLPQALGDRGKEGSKLDADRVLKLIPQWSESVSLIILQFVYFILFYYK